MSYSRYAEKKRQQLAGDRDTVFTMDRPARETGAYSFGSAAELVIPELTLVSGRYYGGAHYASMLREEFPGLDAYIATPCFYVARTFNQCCYLTRFAGDFTKDGTFTGNLDTRLIGLDTIFVQKSAMRDIGVWERMQSAAAECPIPEKFQQAQRLNPHKKPNQSPFDTPYVNAIMLQI